MLQGTCWIYMPMLSLRPSLQSKCFAGYVVVIFLCLFSPLLLQTVSNPSIIETNSGDLKRGTGLAEIGILN